MNDFAYIFGYLIVIARNLCINHKRDEKSRYTIEDYSVSTSDVAYEQKELVDLISSAMDTLDIHHKEALVLRLYQGMSYREMAEVMNMTESYAKTLTWRAKEKLKDMLSPYLEDLSNNK
jgi:RNA polymerase sigma-70 factor, ECF subfamily